VDAGGEEQDSRPGASLSPAQCVVGVAVYYTLEDTAPLFKWFKSLRFPVGLPFPNNNRTFLPKCLCEMTTTSISFGPPSTTEKIRLGILPRRLSTGYNFHFFPSLSWSPTVLTPQPISPDSEATDYDSLLGSGPPVSFALALSSEQIYLSPLVSSNVRASSQLSVSTSSGSGHRPRLCSRGAQQWN
jgi:hypothetical protein